MRGEDMTPRGLTIYAAFTDRYGTRIRVQQSSLAAEACCWIFADSGAGGTSPHLTVDQARMTRDALDAFIRDAEISGTQP